VRLYEVLFGVEDPMDVPETLRDSWAKIREGTSSDRFRPVSEEPP
jgi:hypothetical protein